MRVLVLLLLSFSLFGQTNKQRLTDRKVKIGVTERTVASDPDFIFTRITVVDGAAAAVVRVPENVYSAVPDGGWPVIVFLGGDGSDITSGTASLAAMSTGDNLTYTLAPAISGRLLSKSVIIRVNGVATGFGQFGGTITGSGITTGSFSISSATPTISVTFSSSQVGNTITADYVYSLMLNEGPALYANTGDTFDERCIFIAIQNVQDNNNQEADYVLNSITWAYKEYDVNPNRLYVSGLSRGGIALLNTSRYELLYKFYLDTLTGTTYTAAGTDRVETGIMAMTLATADWSGGYTNIASYKTAMVVVHGGSDGTLTEETNNIMGDWGAQTLINYPFCYVPTAVGHSATLWHTNFYNRLYRTDAAGAAPWDWIDFSLKYSYDATESADLAMQQAEKRRYNTWRDIDDWRFAALKIGQLSASAEKTALETRLTTLRTAIGETFFVIVHSTAAVSNSAYYTVNSMTNHADNQTITDLEDIDGTTHSGTSFGTGNSPLTATYEAAVSNDAGTNNAGGFPIEYNDYGAVINVTGGGTLPMTTSGFGTGTYAIRIYIMSRTATDVGGTVNSVSKTIGSKNNSLLGYVEWDGLTEAQIANYTVDVVNAASQAYWMTITEIIKY